MPLVAPATREHTIRIVAVDTTTGILTTERPHGMMQDTTGARSCVRLVGDDLPGGTSDAVTYRAILKQYNFQATPFQFKLSATPVVTDTHGRGATHIPLTSAGTTPFYALSRLDTGNDRALDKLVSYLQTWMNLFGATLYQSLRPDPRAVPQSNLPALYTTIGNPLELFDENLTPGLWIYRKSPQEFARVCADFTQSTSTIVISWRLPPIKYTEYVAGFAEQLVPFGRIFRSAFDHQRHPSHIEADDTEPQAAEYGTLVHYRAHLMRCDVTRVESTPVEIPMREDAPSKDARISFGLTVTLDVAEMADSNIERFDETPEEFQWL